MDKVWVRKFWEYDAWDEVDPYVENANTILPREKVVPIIEKYFNTTIDWTTMGEYMAKLEDMGISYNYIPNVGHGDIRAQVLGGDNRKPDGAEMKEMKRYLDQALNEGVWGMTTGMDYAPGNFADLDELTELVSMVKDCGGIYTTHWKNRGADEKARIAGLQEGFEVARRTGVRLHMNHLSDLFYTTPMAADETPKSRAAKTLKFIDDAKEEGISFIFDVIPNVDAGFEYTPYLAGYFMPWIRISGGVEQFLENLKKRDFCGWLKDWLLSGRGGLINPVKFMEWDKWLLILSSKNPAYSGKSVRELFDGNLDRDAVDTVLRLLVDDPMMRTRVSRFNPQVVKEFYGHELALVGIDAFNFDGFGTFGRKKFFPDILVHPNTFYSMVNYILHFGEERLEDTVRKITGKPADWLKLDDRGYLKEGYWADINVFSPSELCTNENYIDPVQYPGGIDYVFVNGTMVIREGEHTEARPGKVLRRR
jgi:N-acyl-D-aspartate/D-glutamate deacylase